MAIDYQDSSGSAPVESVTLDDMEAVNASVTKDTGPQKSFPDPIIQLSEETKKDFLIWIDNWLQQLQSEQQPKIDQWAEEEKAYRAKSLGPRSYPFKGACGDVVPLIAMAVDPIHARLDVGIFKNDRILKVKALRKSMLTRSEALEKWLDYYVRHQLMLRQVAQPRFLEFTKHGTMIFKTIYDDDTRDILTYDRGSNWEVKKQKITKFRGPRVKGIALQDLLFPPQYQYLQDCPIVFERQRVTLNQLYTAEAQGKITNCKAVKGQELTEDTELDIAREKSANHTKANFSPDKVTIWEGWCDYDINNDNIPERLVFSYHYETRTLLQLRYNWYFHQRKPYTLIPYQVVNDSLYGLGLCEMILPFQESATQWHRMATDNAYLANIRMFIAKKDSGIEDAPSLFSGRVFKVDDPSKDFIPFAAADIYNSTLEERQNILGLSEKRTGVSDYLTGRESPIVGSRATATSTMALIKEGTQRVEEVLENIRIGLSEIVENCIYIWMQYGLEGLDDAVFGTDEMVQDLKDFFDDIDEDSFNGAIAIDISATDAANNRSVQQQMQLAIIQVMMTYLKQLLEAGQAALQAMQTMPDYSAMVGEVMGSARKMFRDLLVAYDIRNPEEYLPDLEKFLDGYRARLEQAPPGGAGGPANAPPGPGGQPSVPSAPRPGPGVPQPAAPGSGNGAGQPTSISAPGGSSGLNPGP